MTHTYYYLMNREMGPFEVVEFGHASVKLYPTEEMAAIDAHFYSQYGWNLLVVGKEIEFTK